MFINQGQLSVQVQTPMHALTLYLHMIHITGFSKRCCGIFFPASAEFTAFHACSLPSTCLLMDKKAIIKTYDIIF